MTTLRRFVLIAATLAFATLSGSSGAEAAPARFNQYVGFGDSTQDSGYFRYNTTGSAANDQAVAAAVAQGASGAFVGPGVVNSIIFAGKYGLGGGPIGGGGSNYANGGAFTAPLRASAGDPYLSGVAYPTNIATDQQIQNYLVSTGGVANPKGIYMVKTGDNDLNFVRVVESARPGWLAANPTFLHDVNVGLVGNVAALQAAGARTILVPNSYNYAVFAGLGGSIPDSLAAVYARSCAYNNEKWALLTQAGVRFVPADIDSLMKLVVKNPTLFGFTPASVLSANALSSSQSALLVSGADVTPAQMQSTLFIGANGVHFTTAGQQIEADYDSNLLNAPVQMSLLTEAPVQGGLARAATIQGQIDMSWKHRGPNGINVWASGGGGALKIFNAPAFPDENGNPIAGSVGVDYQFGCGLILGAAFTAATQTQNFSMNGGHYNETDEAVSLYTAYKTGPVWANVVASYGWNQDTITRPAQLGLYTDQNTADTTGQSLALALRLGGDIHFGPVTTGPVAGMVLQQVRIKGFTETGASGVTALSFGEQTRYSTVSQLGWRVLADLGKWQPFAEAAWNHELANTDRRIKAAITTAVAAPYAMDAAPVATDWATASLGASYKINEQWMLRGALSATAFNPQTVSYGGELGVSVSF
ncbi:MAG: autotransporter domain-containing protein [Desulfovibrionaceae bacterium]|nr:autotransporter domain-containing protein [Desulfovibrionaceae bacterium]MBF0512733.1 autotransporter domain-containing protein [Desulfovibrionaceae bacterium]